MPGLSPTDDYLFGEFSVGAMSTIYGMVNDRIEPLVLRLDEKVQVYSDERTYLCEDGTTYAYQIAQIEGEEDGVRNRRLLGEDDWGAGVCCIQDSDQHCLLPQHSAYWQHGFQRLQKSAVPGVA